LIKLDRDEASVRDFGNPRHRRSLFNLSRYFPVVRVKLWWRVIFNNWVGHRDGEHIDSRRCVDACTVAYCDNDVVVASVRGSHDTLSYLKQSAVVKVYKGGCFAQINSNHSVVIVKVKWVRELVPPARVVPYVVRYTSRCLCKDGRCVIRRKEAFRGGHIEDPAEYKLVLVNVVYASDELDHPFTLVACTLSVHDVLLLSA